MTATAYHGISQQEYNRRIRAWTLYDWANSAFATTILAAVLPIYYSQVAGATLPSEAVATRAFNRPSLRACSASSRCSRDRLPWWAVTASSPRRSDR